MSKFSVTAQRLREAREERKWSQSELARISKAHDPKGEGLSAGAIGNFEQGIRRPKPSSARILESIFNLPAPYFMGEITLQEAKMILALRDSK